MDAFDLAKKERVAELKITCPYRKMKITARGQQIPENKSCNYYKHRGRMDCRIVDHSSECPVIREIATSFRTF